MMAQTSKNFNISEMVAWPQYQGMPAADLQKCTELIAKNFTAEIAAQGERIMNEAQIIRDWINAKYPQENNKIGLRIVSGFRPVEWELYRKRSGKSQHTKGHAIDFIVVGVDAKKAQMYMNEIYNRLVAIDWNGGLARLYKGGRYGFIHIDLGGKRRWEY
jgi:hypothetical protein